MKKTEKLKNPLTGRWGYYKREVMGRQICVITRNFSETGMTLDNEKEANAYVTKRNQNL